MFLVLITPSGLIDSKLNLLEFHRVKRMIKHTASNIVILLWITVIKDVIGHVNERDNKYNIWEMRIISLY